MKQVAQRLRDGRVEVLDVPRPAITPEAVIVELQASLLSAGTERTKIETGRKGLVGKARARPDQFRQVVHKARRDGLQATVEAVRMRLDQPDALGYSAAGVASAVGERVTDLAPGERVACGGGGYAVHAETVQVPGNLCVPIPEGVSFAEAAFATVGSIALHGVRQADVRLGERVAVIGLGLIGQLAAQLLRAAGCRVVGIDLSPALVERARESGAVDAGIVRGTLNGSLPHESEGCDAVLITAATRSGDPIELAARLSRDRGRVVVVGDVGMTIPRAPYYRKELELRLSRSYGPGRYDRQYEEHGVDYPIGYVRWTERRNMAAFLELVAAGKIDVQGLVTDEIPVEDAPVAYERLLSDSDSPLGVVLRYRPEAPVRPVETPLRRVQAPSASTASVIGAGSFAQRILIPGLKETGFELSTVASGSGLSARAAADRFGFARATGPDEAIADPDAGLVAIATRHSSHARLAAAALRGGRAVFVEKPPCLTASELEDLRAARAESGQMLAVGFNRRHAPLAVELRDRVAAHGAPLQILYRVAADRIDADHWLNDPDEGGGRLLGEGCHFVDFACWLAGSPPERVSCFMSAGAGVALAAAPRFTIALEFADGSLATILYGDVASAGIGKERVEVHGGGASAVLDDFRTLTVHVGRDRHRERSRGQDKGHVAQLRHLREALEGRATPSAVDHLDTMEATLAALASAQLGRPVCPGEELP